MVTRYSLEKWDEVARKWVLVLDAPQAFGNADTIIKQQMLERSGGALEVWFLVRRWIRSPERLERKLWRGRNGQVAVARVSEGKVGEKEAERSDNFVVEVFADGRWQALLELSKKAAFVHDTVRQVMKERSKGPALRWFTYWEPRGYNGVRWVKTLFKGQNGEIAIEPQTVVKDGRTFKFSSVDVA